MEKYVVYHEPLPPILRELAETPLVQRLRQVGMNCGCEYTRFPLFADCAPYSRYEHSLGVGAIVWHFTGDAAAAAAGLLHDIATPAFAHVIDFLRGDHVKQESTEDGTREMIGHSDEIQSVLKKYGLTTAQVADYHQYPIADNDTPRLSADRLEYTLGNLIRFGFGSAADARRLYADLAVLTASDGSPELGFQTQAAALEFAGLALRCSRVYVSDTDRFAMQALAELIRSAVMRGVLTEADLYTTEPQVIAKLQAEPATAREWKHFTAYSRILTAEKQSESGRWLRVNAKKRYIDPLTKGGKRASELSAALAEEQAAFLAQRFDHWLSAE